MINWNSYLESICNKYAQWWQVYTLTDVEGRQRVEVEALFDFTVETVQSNKGEPSQKPEKIERLGVLEGLQKYAKEHVLLVGRPGSGKSTALARLLLEEAEKARSPLNPRLERREEDSSTTPLKRWARGEQKIPVLVELRYYQTSVLDLIQQFLQRHDPALDLDDSMLKSWLRQGQLLLLMDGLNELPFEAARRDLKAFRQNYSATPMIFTTRDLGVGGDLGITKKLEMHPLTEAQMGEFLRKYLPSQGEQMLRQLGERLQEFGQTPLLLWMLCSVFKAKGKVLPNLGLVFRQFTRIYDNKLKQDVAVMDDSRRWWQRLLEHLALRMTQGREQAELQVAIPRQEAEEILTEFLRQEKFDKPRDRVMSWLQDLLNHHLIQLGAEDKIEFRHQLIQEYYTAESLLKQLPALGDYKLKREYLNYLKWTEPLVLMLALVDDEFQAKRVVELALEVDWKLGARLSGAVKPEFQAKTVELVANKEIPQWFKVDLLGMTRSEAAISSLFQSLKDGDSDVRFRAAGALGKIGNEAAVTLLIQALKDEDSFVRSRAAEALGNIAKPELLPELFESIKTTRSNLGNTISEIQKRCKYYNYTLTQPETKPNPAKNIPPAPIPVSVMHILHLSDLHFGTIENAKNWYNQLAEDLSKELDCPRLDTLILSGDIANKSTPSEYNAAKQFLDNVCQEFQLQPQQIVIVPGNHDLNWELAEQAYILVDRQKYQGELQEGSYIPIADGVIRVRDEDKYKERFANFSKFYQDIKRKSYPLEYEQQSILYHLPEQNLLILGLNSAWQLDHHYKSRASINAPAINKALTDIRRNPAYKDCLKLAVWHHPLNSAFEDRIIDHGFMEQLAKAGFRFALHGHIHKAETSLFKYDLSPGGRKLDIICAGTFGAPVREWVPGYPLQYNLLKLESDQLTVYTRRREELNGTWKPDARWLMGKGENPLPYYVIPLFAA